MGKTFKNQTKLSITLQTDESFVGVTVASARIHYKKPDGTLGFFPATVVDAATGTLRYAIASSTDIDQSNTWVFWARVVDDQGLVYIGEPMEYTFYNEGE
jgi:hypothetical protein